MTLISDMRQADLYGSPVDDHLIERVQDIAGERDHYKAALEKILVREPAGHYRYSAMGMVGIAAKALRKGDK